jgi:type II restriction enzyme
MKLGFEETQTPYTSGSQSARAWTERWVREWVYCPNCGNAKINPFPNNSPLADFFCGVCSEEYELKSQRGTFGNKVADGAFQAKCVRLAANNNPSLFLLNYDLKQLSVTNLFIVPKHFFVRDIIEERKPLAPTARRAGWIGSNILLNKVPASGKICIVRNGIPQPKEAILAEQEFQIEDVYAFEEHLSQIYPGNQNVRPKIRQQLQYLRDRGYLDFVARGYYRLRAPN